MLKPNTIKRTKRQFGTQARFYDKYRARPPQEICDLPFKILQGSKIKKVLDLGCGTGKSTEPLVRSGIKIVGCDHDSRMLKIAKKNALKKKLPISYKKCKAENLHFQENSFDLVIIGNAFHWFANKLALKSIKRILKSGGLLFIYWTEIDKEDARLRMKIFGHFNSQYKNSSVLIADKKCEKLLKENSFYKIKHLKRRYTFARDLEMAIGRLKTIGSYFNLSKKQKLEFDNFAKKTFQSYIIKKGKIEFTSTINICYAYKK